MSIPINAIRPPAGIESIALGGGQKPSGPAGAFQSVLSEALGHVQQTQDASKNTIDRFLTGENEEVHQVAIDTQKTELEFDMFMAIRNKMVSAYQEVMRMQM